MTNSAAVRFGPQSELPELLKLMLDPTAYPHQPDRVELIQTQMSFVFLAGDLVYKIKKPVDLGYLDYTTLDKRRRFCEMEVELNRRLCPEVYLGVVPITRANGQMRLGAGGENIEYAVKMRRLPPDRMMDVLLGRDMVTPEMAASVAARLAEFHASAETGPAVAAFGTAEAIKINTDENFAQTERCQDITLPREVFRRLKNYTEAFMVKNARLFERRAAENRIRDCHGDLHAAHVCFTDGICIYDCIEFNNRFRYCDVASEVAFLAMDLDHYGRADLSQAFVKSYIDLSRDEGLRELLGFYKSYRAYVRGKVEGFKLDDPHFSPAEKIKVRSCARSYFDLAEAYTREKPLLLITVGLVGTGKSVLARELAHRLGLVVISSDIIRKKLAGIPPAEHRFEEFDFGIYSPDFSRLTYDSLMAEARAVLAEGGSVILDASFSKTAERRRAQALARETGANFFAVECTLREDMVRQRLEQRLKETSASDGRWAVYLPQKEAFEKIVEIPQANHVIIDTSQPVEEAAESVIARLRASPTDE